MPFQIYNLQNSFKFSDLQMLTYIESFKILKIYFFIFSVILYQIFFQKIIP